jgi:hypothetical protein
VAPSVPWFAPYLRRVRWPALRARYQGCGGLSFTRPPGAFLFCHRGSLTVLGGRDEKEDLYQALLRWPCTQGPCAPGRRAARSAMASYSLLPLFLPVNCGCAYPWLPPTRPR